MKATAVVDLQYGSTAKGLVCYALAMSGRYDAAACAFSPNAGHTVVDVARVAVMRALPVSLLHRGVDSAFLGPGAAVDIDNLAADLETVRAWRGGLEGITVYIHAAAGFVLPSHREDEARRLSAVASTMKGSSGPALDRLLRDAEKTGTAFMCGNKNNTLALQKLSGSVVVVSNEKYLTLLNACKRVLVEGAQGYSLGPSAGFWPKCTYRECTAQQLLADTLVPARAVKHVVGVARTFPIRVGNTADGDSGGFYSDQRETSFEDLGVATEYTTVTKRPRRIFTFSDQQYREAMMANGCTHVVGTFLNYLSGVDEGTRNEWLRSFHAIANQTGARVAALSFSRESRDIAASLEAVIK
jgi:adenylosuccinate synthase